MSATGTAEPIEPDATLADIIAVCAGALGALMATLDISIVNSALPQIQGEIGASGTEGTWIGTGYLISEVVMIPLAAWLTRVFGLRNFLLGCAGIFTLFSILCGAAHTLPEMIIGRVGQGFTGGALIPTAQMIVATRLNRRQMPVGMTVFGFIILLGPIIGPILGGWLSVNVSWRWCFFINVPVFFLLVGLLFLGVTHRKIEWNKLINADWGGIIGMTVGLSCFTCLLEEGQRERWFESPLIIYLAVAAFLGFAMLLYTQMTVAEPIVKFRLMLNRSYASVIIIVVAFGAAMYGVLYILPQFLSLVARYNALQSGQVLLLSSIPAILVMPLLYILLQQMGIRAMTALGLSLMAVSCFLDTNLTTASSGSDFIWSQLLRGAGQMFAMMPLNQASMGAVTKDEMADAAGLYNMARNLGGSIGLACIGVFVDRGIAWHSAVLREAVSANSSLAQAQVTANAAGLATQTGDFQYSWTQALAQLAAQIQSQALVITYNECFFALGITLLVCIPLVFLLKNTDGQPPTMGH